MAIFKSKKQKDIIKKIVDKRTSELKEQNDKLTEDLKKAREEINEMSLEDELNLEDETGNEIPEEDAVDKAYTELFPEKGDK